MYTLIKLFSRQIINMDCIQTDPSKGTTVSINNQISKLNWEMLGSKSNFNTSNYHTHQISNQCDIDHDRCRCQGRSFKCHGKAAQ